MPIPPHRADPTGRPTAPRPVVFLGPSLAIAEARSLVEAEFRPPIRRGDLAAVPPGGLALIIDGEFHQSLPVSPKEIVRAIDAGVVVLGAASMGALRAVETASEGMIGIGRVFEAYRSGRIVGDDEVAVSYCPFGFEAWTVPLVNVRFWLDGLAAAGLVSEPERATCLRRARRIFYADRTPGRLARALDACLGVERIRRIEAAGLGAVPDPKAEDARAALSAVARMVESPQPLQRSRA